MKPCDLMLAAVLAVAPPALAAPKIDPAPVVAAERAFAADGLKLGVKASFLKHHHRSVPVEDSGIQSESLRANGLKPRRGL